MFRTRSTSKVRRRPRTPFAPGAVQGMEQRASTSAWWGPAVGTMLPLAIAANGLVEAAEPGDVRGDDPGAGRGSRRDGGAPSADAGSAGLRVYYGDGEGSGAERARFAASRAGDDARWQPSAPAWESGAGVAFISPGGSLGGNPLGDGGLPSAPFLDGPAAGLGLPPLFAAASRGSSGFDAPIAPIPGQGGRAAEPSAHAHDHGAEADATGAPPAVAGAAGSQPENAAHPIPPTTLGIEGMDESSSGGMLFEEPSVKVTITAVNDARETGNTGIGSPGMFTVTRTGDASYSSSMAFNLVIEPTTAYLADNNPYADAYLTGVTIYNNGGSIIWAAGQSTVTITVTPYNNTAVTGNKTVTLQLQSYSGAVYTGTGNATVNIIDDDSPTPTNPTVTVTQRNDGSGAPLSCGCDTAYNPNTGAANAKATSAGRPNCGANQLVYSASNPTKPTFDVTYKPEPGGSLPPTINAKVTVNGSQLADVYVGTAGGSASDGVAFSLQVDTGSITTEGLYSYSVVVTGSYSGGGSYTQTISSSMVIRTPSFPTTGDWQFSNIDRLYVAGPIGYLLHPDGSTTQFIGGGGGGLTSTDDSFLTMTQDSVAGTWIVSDRYGSRDVFDADGRLVRSLDRVGNITTYTYIDADGDGKARELRSVTDPFNRTATYTYSGGKLVSSIDFAGRVTSYTYDGSGRLQSIIQPDPDGPGPEVSPVSTMTYDGSGRLSSINNPGLRLVTLTYDTSGTVSGLSFTGAGTQQFTTAYTTSTWSSGSSYGSITSPMPAASPTPIAVMADALNRITTLHLDRMGRVIKEIDPLGQVTEYKRTNKGLVTELKRPDPDGAGPLAAPVTQYEYDGKGNLTKVTHPDLTTEVWTYDPSFSQVTSYKDATSQITTYTVDPTNGNTTAVTDPLNRTVGYSYTSKGLLQSETLPDPDGAGPQGPTTTTYAYDSRGRLTTVTNPDATTRRFSYSSADDLINAIDELGRVTTFTYDLMSRQTGVILPDPDGAGPLASPAITYKLRGDGLVESQTDALGRITNYSYDSAGRPTGVTLPDPDAAGPATSVTISSAYDVMGRMTTFTDALGRVTAYSFDELGRLKTVTEPGTGSPRTTYTYDPLDRLASTTDALGRVTSYTYDLRDRVVSVTLPDAGGGSPVLVNQYDAAGRLIGQVDPLGRDTHFAYNIAGQLISVTGPDPDGFGPQGSPVASTTYDGRGRVATTTDPLGRVTSYSYDLRDRLATITLPDPDGAGPQASPWVAYQYDAVGNITAVRERVDATRNRITTFVYDNLDRLTEAKNPVYSDQAAATVGTQYAYDAMGNLTKVTDQLGRVTSYAYDGWDRLTTLTLPNPGSGSPVIKYAYDAVSNLLATTDPNGQATSYAYDARDRLTTVTLPDPDGAGPQTSPVAKYAYDLADRLTQTTDALGRITSYAYDALDRLTTVTRPDGGDGNPVTKYGYDLAGNLTRVTDALGRITSYAYDNLDRLTTLTQPAPATGQPLTVSTYEYDLAGNITKATDPNGYERRWSYDALDRLVTETLSHLAGQSATAPKVTLQYDSLGRRTALIDPTSNTTAWEYDARDLVTREVDPRNKSTTYAYDDAGQLTQKVDRNVRRTDYSYDALGRMTTETWYSGATPFRSIIQSYDNLGRLTGVADPAATLTFAYDNLSRLTTATTSGAGTGQPNITLAYGYDAVGNRTSVSDNISSMTGNTTYTYDALDRLTTISRTLGTATMTIGFDYDLGSRLTQMTRRGVGAMGTSYGYDNLDRLTTMTHWSGLNPPGTNLATYGYGYDAGGRLTTETDHRGTATYTYDPQGQLTGIDRPGTAQDRTLTFDANGNRTMSGYATGTGNRLDSGAGFTYTYDDEGNLVGKTEAATGEVTSYTYDHRNRLTHVERRSTTNVLRAIADYTYDGLDRRIKTESDQDGAGWVALVTTWTAYDGLGAYADFDQAGALTMRYLQGPGVDNILGRTTAAGVTFWYATDRLGSVREVINHWGATIASSDYDAFGVLEARTGTLDRWGFTGREWDEASKLQYNRARYYDPATSRWISQDPIGFAAGDQNLYRYVGNSSTNAIDPNGLEIDWSAYTHFLTNPNEMDTGLRNLFYGSVAVGAGASLFLGVGAASAAFGGGTYGASGWLVGTGGMTGWGNAVFNMGVGNLSGALFSHYNGENISSGALLGSIGGTVGGVFGNYIGSGSIWKLLASGSVDGATGAGIEGFLRGKSSDELANDILLGSAFGAGASGALCAVGKGVQDFLPKFDRWRIARSLESDVPKFRKNALGEHYDIQIRYRRSPGSYLHAQYYPEDGRLYVQSYAIAEAHRGSKLSRELFEAAIRQAERHGPVNAITGRPADINRDILLGTTTPGKRQPFSGGGPQINPDNLSKTPWYKVLKQLGYEDHSWDPNLHLMIARPGCQIDYPPTEVNF
jgi:RHS repeat-associated protein